MSNTKSLALGVALAALAVGGPSLASPVDSDPSPAAAARHLPTLRLERIAARVIVIPEARNNITAEVRGGGGDLPRPVLRVDGTDMVVDGGLSRDKMKSCRISGPEGRETIKFGFFFAKSYRGPELPTVTVRVPLDVAVIADGAVIGQVGPSRNLTMRQERCGDWKIGDVGGRLDLTLEGMGDVKGGSAGDMVLSLAGMGDIDMRSTRSLKAELAGMGDLTVGSVNGPVDVELSGMGDVDINGGRATTFRARLSGMGDLDFRGVADSVDAEADGMGDINVAKATGEVRTGKSGIGKVHVGR